MTQVKLQIEQRVGQTKEYPLYKRVYTKDIVSVVYVYSSKDENGYGLTEIDLFRGDLAEVANFLVRLRGDLADVIDELKEEMGRSVSE